MTTTTSQKRIDANRRNSRKSTGPTTPQGRANSSMNALKHGNRSRKLALLREESCAFEERLRKWMAIGDAQNDVEEYLIQGFWQSHDRLKATRLLGRQPVEANDDRRVATIFVANHALRPAGKTAFDDLLSDIHDSQQERYGKAVRERWPDLFRTREKEEWRQMLLALADQNIERLSAKLEAHEQNADAQAERTFALLSFDHSPEGEALRNYLIKCTNGLFRGMANYRKYQQARTSRGWGMASGAARNGTEQDTSEAEAREADDTSGSKLGSDDSFGSGAGKDNRFEPADAIDPDGAEQHGDLMSGMGAIGENAPNEANFDESINDAESQCSIQVTANYSARPGLDNGVAQPGEGSTPEQGEAPGSGSESGGAKSPAPDPGDRAYRGSLPAAVSNREKRRLRREKERRAVERMVEEKLGGNRPGYAGYQERIRSIEFPQRA